MLIIIFPMKMELEIYYIYVYTRGLIELVVLFLACSVNFGHLSNQSISVVDLSMLSPVWRQVYNIIRLWWFPLSLIGLFYSFMCHIAT